MKRIRSMARMVFKNDDRGGPPAASMISYKDGVITHPYHFELSGTFSIDGSVKQDWLEDLFNRLALIMACHLLRGSNSWEAVTPFLAVELKDLIKARVLFSGKKGARVINRLHSVLSGRYMSTLSYIEDGEEPLRRHVSHRWEFDSQDSSPVVISYELTISGVAHLYSDRDVVRAAGYEPLDPLDPTWDHACAALTSRFPSDALDPNDALRHLAPGSHSLKKLALGRYRVRDGPGILSPRHPPSYSEIEKLGTSASAPSGSDYFIAQTPRALGHMSSFFS